MIRMSISSINHGRPPSSSYFNFQYFQIREQQTPKHGRRQNMSTESSTNEYKQHSCRPAIRSIKVRYNTYQKIQGHFIASRKNAVPSARNSPVYFCYNCFLFIFSPKYPKIPEKQIVILTKSTFWSSQRCHAQM